MIELVDFVSVLEKCIGTTYNVDGITNCGCTLSGDFMSFHMCFPIFTYVPSKRISFEGPGHTNE